MNHPTSITPPTALQNGRVPLDGVMTAGQPSAAVLAELAAAGITTVVDLRTSEEPRGFDEAVIARAAGLEYHNIPVAAGSLGSSQFAQVRELLRAVERRPILVHCGSANRVGAVMLPYLVLDEHRAPDEALRIAHEIGLRSDDLARTAFEYIRDQQEGRSTR